MLDMFVRGITSRLVLQVKQTNGGNQFILTFMDVVVKYGGKNYYADLAVAFKRVWASFNGKMAQNFVVLNNKRIKWVGRNAWGGRGWRGAGRPMFSEGNKSH